MLIDALRRLERTPRFHGNGFTQLPLTEKTRLHVWDERLKPLLDHNATIHDHIFEMHSTVLAGELVHRTYREGTFHGEYHAFDRYRVDREEDTLKLEREHVCYVKDGTYHMAAGSRYTFPVRHMHDTEVNGRAVTLMRKERVYDQMEPWVLCPVGEKPMDAFKIDPAHDARHPDALWDVIHEATKNLGPWAHTQIRNALTV